MIAESEFGWPMAERGAIVTETELEFRANIRLRKMIGVDLDNVFQGL
jgi:hypothetical protein